MNMIRTYIRCQKMRITAIFLASMVTILSCFSGQTKENKITPRSDAQKFAMQFKGEKSDPRTYQTIFIHSFLNKTSKGILSPRLKEKLEIAYNADGKLQVRSEKKTAKVWLYGTILKYQKIPIRYNQFNQAVRYRLGIITSIKIVLNPKYIEQTLLERRLIRYDINYNPLEIPFESEFLANERLLDGLANRIIYTSLEGWYSELKSEEELNRTKNYNLINNEELFIRKDLPKDKK